MSIFSRKEKVNLEDFCRDIYDNQYLNPKVLGDLELLPKGDIIHL